MGATKDRKVDILGTEDHLSHPSLFLKSAVLLNCGLLSGFLQAGIFNPWDRALYLSLKHDRRFLHRHNFISPFAGVVQTITQRAISSGLYFPLEDIYLRMLDVDKREMLPFSFILAGVLAGATNGVIMNPLAAIKYHYWGQVECGKENFVTVGIHMFEKGGIRPFFLGSLATVTRDVIFGGCFAFIRHSRTILSPHISAEDENGGRGFLLDFLAASVATLLSSPFNYVRNMHFATPPGQVPMSMLEHLASLWHDAWQLPTSSLSLRYLQHRLRLGWGTARVGCGMAFGAYMYDWCSSST